MKLPRLRVSQMIFLVVYAALIGSIWQYCLPGGVDTHPSSVPGFLWAPASAVDERIVPRMRLDVDGRRALTRIESATLTDPKNVSDLVKEVLTNPDVDEGTWLLVPEDAVK